MVSLVQSGLTIFYSICFETNFFLFQSCACSTGKLCLKNLDVSEKRAKFAASLTVKGHKTSIRK